MPRCQAARRSLAGLVALLALAVGACGNPEEPSASGAAPQAALPPVTTDKTLAGRVPESIRSTAKLRVVTSSNLPPMTFTADDHTTLVGFDVDLAGALAMKLGLTAEVQTAGFDTLIPSLRSGRYDVAMSSIGVSAERQKQVDLVSYYNGGQGFLAMRGTDFAITTPEQLCGRRVAVQAGSTQQSTLEEQRSVCSAAGRQPYVVAVFPDTSASVLALQGERVDVVYASISIVGYTAAQRPDTFRVAGRYRNAVVGAALPQGSGLTPVLRQAVTALITDGTYIRLLDRWGLRAGAVTEATINGATR